MTEVDKGYELKVLKMVANQYLDETISATEESLKALEANCDQVVWELATRIYSQSGHKVELGILRDVVNSRIEAMKYQLAEEKERMAEQARRVAEEKVAEEERMTEEGQRVAEEKAAEEASLHDEITRIMREFLIEESQAKIFVKLRKIVSEQLEVDENEVNLDSHISKDLRGDTLDFVELTMALEEEFNIEIPDDLWPVFYEKPRKPRSFFNSSIDDSDRGSVDCTIRELLLFIHKKVSS
ncbi:phosphopantetheine-binding protein [Lyngbya aestuarii]|uniref:phosphopantetheine-binding protein n=1 Tax=Lyngbya aestuarii TaxID=118322 RepID=UPI00403D6C7F